MKCISVVVLVIHSVLLVASPTDRDGKGEGRGGGGVNINLGPLVIRAGGGGGGGFSLGDFGFNMGSDRPPKTVDSRNDDPAFIQISGGGFGGGGIDKKTGEGSGGGFGGVSIGNFLRVFGFGGGGGGGRGGKVDVAGGGGGGEGVIDVRSNPGESVKRQKRQIPLGGLGGDDATGGFNISSLLGGGGLAGLVLSEPDPRFKAPGPKPEDELIFAPYERPKYDSQGNVLTPINSRFQIVKAKYALPNDG